jgi:hypothetical protein
MHFSQGITTPWLIASGPAEIAGWDDVFAELAADYDAHYESPNKSKSICNWQWLSDSNL